MPAGTGANRLPRGRLLVAAPERLDDACFSVPAVRALAATDEVERTHVLCGENQAALWQALPGVEALVHPDGAKPRGIRAVIAASGDEYAAALAWQRSSASRAIRMSGIPARFGPAADKRLAADLTGPVAIERRAGPVEHRVRDFLLLAAALGASPFQSANFEPVTDHPETPANSLALVPDSDFGPSHTWPTECWIEAAGELVNRGGLDVMIIDPGHGPVARELAAALGDRAVLKQPRTLSEQLEVIARQRFVVGSDGTAPHLGAHVGATCLVVFGPNDPAWRRPLGKRHVIMRRQVECAPCFRADCPLDHRCMKELESGRVLAAITQLLANGSSA